MKKIVVILAFLLLATIFFLPKTHNPITRIQQDILKSDTLIDQRINGHKPFTVLLLGYGGGNHDGAYLTDSMMVVQVDPSSKSVILISIPRDIWINIPTNTVEGSYWKINAAYTIGRDDTDYPNKLEKYKGSQGAGNLTKDMVTKVTGLSIDRFIAVDFQAFVNVINTLGGVDVQVDKAFDDFAYPINGKENDPCGPTSSTELDQNSLDNIPTLYPCRFEHLHFDQGIKHLDGETALKFVRSRHSEVAGTDFGRSARQRNLLTAVKQKLLSPAIILKILPLYQSLSGYISSDFSLEELNSLIKYKSELESYNIKSVALDDKNVLDYTFTDDGQYILIPKSGKDDWTSIHKWLIAEMNKTTNIDLPIVQIENATDVSGLAEYAANKLKDQNFVVLPVKNSSTKGLEKTTIQVFNPEIDTGKISYLQSDFGAKIEEATSSNGLQYNILITLGKNYISKTGKLLQSN